MPPTSIQGEVSLHMIQMLRCRAQGHQWEDRGWLAMVKQSGVRGWEQLLTCPRCEAKRWDFRVRGSGGTKTIIGKTGKKIKKRNPKMPLFSRYYVYRDDYPGDISQDEALELVIMWEVEHPSEAVQLLKLHPESRVGRPAASAS